VNDQDFPVDVLNARFPSNVVEKKKVAGRSLDFVPWHIYAAFLNWKLPGRWEKEVTDVKALGPFTVQDEGGHVREVAKLIVTVSVTVDGVVRQALGEADATKETWGGAMAEAESQAFRRACAAHGLGLYMYRDGKHAPAGSWNDTQEPSQDAGEGVDTTPDTEEPGEPSRAPENLEPTEAQLVRLKQLGGSGYLPQALVNDKRKLLNNNFTKATAGAIVRTFKETLEKLGYNPEEIVQQTQLDDPTLAG